MVFNKKYQIYVFTFLRETFKKTKRFLLVGMLVFFVEGTNYVAHN